MNSTERKMVAALRELKTDYGAISVRAEFEAEGTKLEELSRLKEISMVAGLELTLKIGGCESVRDMLESNLIGVNQLVAPMVESAYALRKYLQAVKKTCAGRDRLEILVNIETKTAIECLDEMLKVPEIGVLNGIVVERVDLCRSLGLSPEDINAPAVCEWAAGAFGKAKAKNLLCVLGGGLSAQSLDFIRSTGGTDRFETRKICFDAAKALTLKPEEGILKALSFEMLWLKNKMGYYRSISRAEKQRLKIIRSRYFSGIKTA